GASGVKLLRADSAFWNNKLIARLEAAGWTYSISVRLQFWVKDAVAQIPESDWQPLEDYPEEGEAQIAETTVKGRRLIVRRRRLLRPPGRLTRTARQWTLHLPARWPWQGDFIRALARIRALPAVG